MRYEITVLLLLLLFTLCPYALAKRSFSLLSSDPCLEKRTCGKNEEFVCCGPCAEPTCTKPEPNADCTNVCVAGCFCKKNYVRRAIGGSCIWANSCPRRVQTTKKP
ncbi:chymotrypsin inhibitor-like [Anopheles merus]|uniref:TIL domain-containing protein n=1 Tax=Anopheles merus TaxID=30066 RepID=A0A182V216_ANOME|nr:chymotrypsin inhibitor-like [Anopheles merus]